MWPEALRLQVHRRDCSCCERASFFSLVSFHPEGKFLGAGFLRYSWESLPRSQYRSAPQENARRLGLGFFVYGEFGAISFLGENFQSVSFAQLSLEVLTLLCRSVCTLWSTGVGSL